jgi:hypothetical protein
MENENVSLHFLTLANKYLILVQNILNESVKSENVWMITDGEYDEKTKWSDFNIFIPTLFNFYHGIEILMKGILLIENPQVKLNHNLEKLFKDIQKLFETNHEFVLILEKYINKDKLESNLKYFFNENKISPRKFYDALKYPFNKNLTKNYDYFSLKYREGELLPLFKEMTSDIAKINSLAVEYASNKHIL